MTIVVAAHLPGSGTVVAGDGMGHNPRSGTVNSRDLVKWIVGPPGWPGGPWALGIAGDLVYLDIIGPAFSEWSVGQYGIPPSGEAGAQCVARAVREAVSSFPGARPVYLDADDNVPDWGVAPILAHSSGLWQLCSDLVHLYPGMYRNGLRFVAQGHAREVANGAMWQAAGWSETANPRAVVAAGMEAAVALVMGVGGECFFQHLPEAPGGG